MRCWKSEEDGEKGREGEVGSNSNSNGREADGEMRRGRG